MLIWKRGLVLTNGRERRLPSRLSAAQFGAFQFVAGRGEWSPPKRGCENFPTMSTSAPLGSPVSAEYDPMRTAAKWSVHEGAGESNGLRRRIVGSVGRQVGSDPETRSHRKPMAGLHRHGSQTIHADGLQ